MSENKDEGRQIQWHRSGGGSHSIYAPDSGHMQIAMQASTPPASQESAGEAVSRLRERAQNEATSIALNQMLNDRDQTIATLTAELAAMQEQRDSLRDECGRLRGELVEAIKARGAVTMLLNEANDNARRYKETLARLHEDERKNVSYLIQQYDRKTRDCEELRGLLSGVVSDIDDLVGESRGVYGLHLNGDGAPWDELLPGGQFERLTHLDDARVAALSASGREGAAPAIAKQGEVGRG